MRPILSWRFVARLVIAFLLFSAICVAFARPFADGTAPWIGVAMRRIYPQYHLRVLAQDDALVMVGQVFGEVDVGGRPRFAEITIKGRVEPAALYIIPLIFFPLLLSWPDLTVRYRLIATAAMLPVVLAVCVLDISLLLVDSIEKQLRMDTIGQQVRQYLCLALNRGGRQFLALLLFCLALAPLHLKRLSTAGAPVGRNSACPCGSGKKYKKCCLAGVDQK